MIDHRNEIEVSLFDTDERIQALARAAREQCCDLVVAVSSSQGGPLQRLIEAIATGCPGSMVQVGCDGPTFRIAVLDPSEVHWERALALLPPEQSPGVWRCMWRSLRARLGGAR